MKKTKQTEDERKEKKKVYDAAYRIKNLDRINTRIDRWRKENSEKSKACRAAWRKANPEKMRLYKVTYVSKNPERRKASIIAWEIANPESAKIKAHNYRARKISSGGKLSKGISEKLFFLQKGKCAICRKSFKKVGYHLDHIVPLARGGKNIDSNVQLTCPKCNRKKSDKDPIIFMQERGYLL